MKKTIAMLEDELKRESARAEENARLHNSIIDQDRVLRKSLSKTLNIGSYPYSDIPDWREIFINLGKILGRLEHYELQVEFDKLILERDELLYKQGKV